MELPQGTPTAALATLPPGSLVGGWDGEGGRQLWVSVYHHNLMYFAESQGLQAALLLRCVLISCVLIGL